jgi:hypothetical protein
MTDEFANRLNIAIMNSRICFFRCYADDELEQYREPLDEASSSRTFSYCAVRLSILEGHSGVANEELVQEGLNTAGYQDSAEQILCSCSILVALANKVFETAPAAARNLPCEFSKYNQGSKSRSC